METLGELDELKYKPAVSLGCMIARPDPRIFDPTIFLFKETKAGNFRVRLMLRVDKSCRPILEALAQTP
jgi:hypothetical protein